MQTPEIPQNEAERLQALINLNLLDTDPEESYDCITELAKTLFDVPIVAISLIDSERQWFKSIQGLDVCEISREVSFCGHAILEDELFIVPDATKDERFADNPLVTGEPKIRYYASSQLKSANGYHIGTLCIIDTKPRDIPIEKLNGLKKLGQLLGSEFLSGRRMHAYLSEIAAIQDRYIAGDSTQDIFDSILSFLLRFTGSEYGFIGSVLKDEKGAPYLKTHAITNIAWNDETQQFYEENAPTGLEFRNLDTLFGVTLKMGEQVISNDPLNDERAGGRPEGHPPLNAYLGMPIYGQSGFVAMYGIANRANGYDEQVVEELLPLTNTMAAIIESSRHYSVMTDMAKTDALTHVSNRHHFEESFQLLLNEHEMNHKTFCLMMIDLDDFKKVNDIHGHPVGDELLLHCAQRLKSTLKSADIVARLGGDEFVVVLTNIEIPNEVGRVTDRLSKVLYEPYFIEGNKIECFCSIGVACYPNAGSTAEELIQHVDMALYEAKKTKKTWLFYSPELRAIYQEKVVLEIALDAAIDKNDFYYEYQPQVCLETGKVCGAELLLRWQSDEYGQVSPECFVPLLEEMGKGESLNRMAIETATQDLPDLVEQQSGPFSLAINISPRVLDLAGHLGELAEGLKKTLMDFPEVTIEFEITEADFMGNPAFFKESLKIALDALSNSGIKLAMDDFGIEYSSLNRLVEYPFDSIKLDRAFTSNLVGENAKTAVPIVRAVLGMANELGYQVIAEGAETKEQLDILTELGCPIVQGFYFYRPMPKEELLKLLN